MQKLKILVDLMSTSSSAYILLPNMGIYATNSAINRIFYAFNFENNRDDIDIHIVPRMNIIFKIKVVLQKMMKKSY